MGFAFDLQTRDDGLATLVFDLPHKKVNVFTRRVLAEFEDLLADLTVSHDIRALILLSGKPGSFIAGFDVGEIAGVTEPAAAVEGSRLGHRLFDAWNRLPYPTIAAVRGTCLGGGTELSLASNYIVISDRPDIRIGLPEVRLGIVPAWGGCSRLPDRIGVTAALDIILAGKAIDGKKAHRIGLADALLPDASFPHLVRDFATAVIAGEAPDRRRPNLKSRLLEANAPGRGVVFSQARKRVLAKTGGHYPAPLRAIEVVEQAVTQGLAAGLEAEARATGELAVSPVSKNLVHVFHLMEAVKHQTLTAAPSPVASVGVVGAGIMGGGIAQLVADRADIPVRLKDLGSEPLARGLAHASRLFDKQVDRRRLTRVAAKRKLNLILPTLDDSGFQRLDLVIEAIVERLDIKQKVFADLAGRVSGDTILASNTSSLSIDSIAQATPHPDRVVGMHFFNPVHRMPLVEIIKGRATSDQTLSTAFDFARRLGKTPVVVGNGPGFLVNRLLGFYMMEALWLLDDGADIAAVDKVMTAWGMPLGPLALIDDVGLDVAVEVAHILAEAFDDRFPLPEWVDRIAASDRLGSKSGRGLYLYSNGERQRPDPDIYRYLGLSQPNADPGVAPLTDRLVLPMVDEAARCLEEGIARTPGDVDLAMIMGTGFPPFRGGLCRWADSRGLGEAMDTLVGLAETVGARFQPSAALERTVKAGGFYTRFTAN